jgi:regulator of cell morphogenesis and NO signaling
MMKEERVLFPLVAELETAAATNGRLPAFHCGSVNNPLDVMEDEHEHAGEALAKMRSLTQGYAPPPDACPTYVALLAGLAELEADLHLHIHKENNIMFPRAAKLEAQLHIRTYSPAV